MQPERNLRKPRPFHPRPPRRGGGGGWFQEGSCLGHPLNPPGLETAGGPLRWEEDGCDLRWRPGGGGRVKQTPALQHAGQEGQQVVTKSRVHRFEK